MRVARVTGSLHATLKNSHLEGQRLLVVRAVDLEQRPVGPPLICVDRVDAGVGDLVLVNKEGSGARHLLSDKATPVQGIVVGVVDRMQVQISKP